MTDAIEEDMDEMPERRVNNTARVRPSNGRQESRTGTHKCHAFNCEVRTPPRMFMCAKHWRMVPKAMQDELGRG